jgi:hypothetical protein
MTIRDRINEFLARGFDQTKRVGTKVLVSCSQCQATRINGVYCHEVGCMNSCHECRGCNTLIPLNQKYCPDCM